MIYYILYNYLLKGGYLAMSERKTIAVRVAPDIHKAVRQIALDNDVTVQDYLIGLVLNNIENGNSPELLKIWEKLESERG